MHISFYVIQDAQGNINQAKIKNIKDFSEACCRVVEEDLKSCTCSFELTLFYDSI